MKPNSTHCFRESPGCGNCLDESAAGGYGNFLTDSVLHFFSVSLPIRSDSAPAMYDDSMMWWERQKGCEI